MEEQNYQNHRKYVPLFHFVTIGLALVNLVLALVALFRAPSVLSVSAVLVAVLLGLLAYFIRDFVLTVQNRVIRLEERLRLAQLLPPDLRPRIHELTTRQLIGLRFASDEELPELVRQVLDEKIRSGEQIKKMIRTWRPDHLRA